MFTGAVISIDLEDHLDVDACIGPNLETDPAGPKIKILLEDIEPLSAGIQFAIQRHGVFFGKESA